MIGGFVAVAMASLVAILGGSSDGLDDPGCNGSRDMSDHGLDIVEALPAQARRTASSHGSRIAHLDHSTLAGHRRPRGFVH